jgi:DNA-binding transcriptional regulator PaaX
MNMKDLHNMEETISLFVCSNDGKESISKKVLAIIGLAGVVTAGMVVPNILTILNKRDNNYSKKQVSNALCYLKRDGFVMVIHEGDKRKIELTKRGKQKLYNSFMYDVHVKKPKIWDRKWRVVIFDIPVKYNRQRTVFRRKIKAIGFFQMQKSVWIYPYKCEDEIFYLAKLLNIDKYMDILLVKKYFNDQKIKRYFKM